MTEQGFYRRYLPHWHPANAMFFVTFRLEGSLPQAVIRTLHEEYQQVKRLVETLPPSLQTQKLYDTYRKAYAKLDEALHESQGPRWLQQPEIAEIVQREIHSLHPQEYHLLAYCLMPNHVHLLVDMEGIPSPYPTKTKKQWTALTYALWLLKGRSGYACRKVLGSHGRFWSREFYDHVVRNEREFNRILTYIINNPVKAGLVSEWNQWPYTYADEKLL